MGPRQDAADAGLTPGGTSTISAASIVHTHSDARGETRQMNRAAAVNKVPRTESPPEAAVELSIGGRQWCLARPTDQDLVMGGVDWFDLEKFSGAVLVKRNSQRSVWRVGVQGHEYFAKVYYPNGPMSRLKLLFFGATALREWNVGRYAAQHGVAAVVPVAAAWNGPRGRTGPSLLITEAVADVEPLNDYWLRVREDRRAAGPLTDSLARLIARAHQCGFRHGDLHPGNILVRHNGGAPETFFVDLHKVRIGRPVGFNAVAANLAQLNQWFRRHATRTQLRRFLRHYLAYRDRFAQAGAMARNLAVQPAELVAHLVVEADKHARALYAKRDRRIWRTGHYFAKVRPAAGWRGNVLLRSKHPAPSACAARLTYTREQWRQWLRDPLAWVRAGGARGLAQPDGGTMLKDSHTATVTRAILPTSPAPVSVVVKRPLARNAWKRLGQVLGPSRNRRAWRMANMLLNRGLSAAQPMAVVERRVAGIFRVDSVSFTDFVAGGADLEAFLTRDIAALDGAAQRRLKDRLIESVTALLKLFHERGFVHRDFKAPNLLVNWEPPYPGRPKLTFIDMDGISHVRRVSDAQRRRALVRLGASLMGSPACTRADRLRFLKRYLIGPGRTDRGWKDEWRRIAADIASKMHDKDERRLWKLDHYGRE
jgi:tRNA A-37 threonylcarbamoyl transferase component Bud32